MAKQTGMGAAFYVAGYDIGGDTQTFTLHGGPAALDVTDVTQSAYSRLGGLRSAEVNWVSYHDPAANASHAALSTLPTADVIATAVMPPVAVGTPALSQVSKQINYDPARAADGMLTFAINDQSNAFGQEWGVMLTAGKRVDTVATAGPFFDNLASFAFGAQAYLQVFAFSGTDVTIAIQHATTSGGAYSNIIPFTQVTTAPQAQRASVSNVTAINEFLKVTTTTVGGFSSVTFAVQITVNPVAGVVF
jgi:hypothetical protein